MAVHANKRFARYLAYVCVFSFLLSSVLLVPQGSNRVSAEAMVYRSVSTDKKQIALTFDDGPHPSQTLQILDLLDRYNARATFFMIGVNVERYPDAAMEVIRRGHEVGNHTYSHSHLHAMGEWELDRELGRCEDALENLCEYRPHLFRPPEGVFNSFVEHCSEQKDYAVILWSVDTKDWETKCADSIVEKVLTSVRPGDIILMHDYVAKSQTPEALERLLPKLRAMGYEFVTVSELLGLR